MSTDQPLADYEVGSGALRGLRLTLYANRLVFEGSDAMETVPLAQLASVRVAFERNPRTLNWAIVLLVLALALAAVSGPLQAWMTQLASKVGESAGRESLEAVLLAVFTGLGNLARLLSPIAIVLAAGAVALLMLFWLGRTTLALAFAATERSCTVRGRDRSLVEFAGLIGEQLAARKD